jgi:hypothetical protein
MAGLQAASDEVDIERLHFFDYMSLGLGVGILDELVSAGVDEVFDYLGFYVQLSLQSISEEIDGDESVLVRVEGLEGVINLTNNLNTVELRGVFEEWWW